MMNIITIVRHSLEATPITETPGQAPGVPGGVLPPTLPPTPAEAPVAPQEPSGVAPTPQPAPPFEAVIEKLKNIMTIPELPKIDTQVDSLESGKWLGQGKRGGIYV